MNEQKKIARKVRKEQKRGKKERNLAKKKEKMSLSTDGYSVFLKPRDSHWARKPNEERLFEVEMFFVRTGEVISREGSVMAVDSGDDCELASDRAPPTGEWADGISMELT